MVAQTLLNVTLHAQYIVRLVYVYLMDSSVMMQINKPKTKFPQVLDRMSQNLCHKLLLVIPHP